MNLLIYGGVLLPLIEELVLTGGVLLPLIEEADLTDWCQMSIICGRHGNLIHILGSLGRCLCNKGFTGTCCETNIDECTSMPCQHGVCYDGINNFTCSCFNGYTGSRCETNIDECTSMPCQHGVCYDGINNFTCSCINGYTGSRCETNIDECTSMPCQHGVCLDGIDKFTCRCINGYTGSSCETNINECASNPCQYGTCTDGVDGYTCSCMAGFHGVNCGSEINECASSPCQNGATCVDVFSGYICQCFEGDSGKNCEIGTPVTKTPILTLISNKTVVEGTAVVTIACNAEGIPSPVVTWEEIDAKLQPNVGQIGHFLVIKNVTMADKGYYICTAKNRVGTEIKAVLLIVTAKTSRPYTAPVISAPSTVKVKYYTDARLVCNITGYPEPTVKWEYSKNKTIPGAKISGGILVIPNITSEATGLYTCIASNAIGSSRANIMLEATYDSPKFVSSPQSYSGNAGAPHNFTCTATGHPVPKITWMFSSFSNHINKLPQHKIHRNGDMIELVNMEESGILTCTATNEFGIATAKAHVIVHHSSSIVG